MPHITIEYVIMIPILILQIFLFPMTANWLMNVWVDSRRSLAVQDAASHLGSTIQQLYFALNHETISSGKATYSPDLPPFIEDNAYIGTAVLQTTSGADVDSSKLLLITLRLANTQTTVTTTAVLGPNAFWQQSTFMSNSTHACISAVKNATGITLRFGE